MNHRLTATLGIVVLCALALALPMARAGANAAAGSSPLVRGPYFGNPTTTSVQIIWVTAVPTDSLVSYGAAVPLTGTLSSSDIITTHVITLTSLLPGTLYSYTVGSSGDATPWASAAFRTLRPAGDNAFTFAVIGDSGIGDSHQYDAAGTLWRARPEFVLHTGDVIYPAGEAANYDPRFFAPYSQTLASAPFFMSPGNHDYMQAGAAPYFDAFYLPRNSATGSESYYAFDYGNLHVVSLDSNPSGTASVTMTAWLTQDLAATTKFWKVVFFHHATYTSASHGGDAYIATLRPKLGAIFEQYNVDLVFNGHDHAYERTTPRRDYVPTSRGVTYIVEGASGAPLYAKAFTNAWTAAFYSTPDYWSIVRADVANCKLTISALKAATDTVLDSLVLDRCNYFYLPILLNPAGGLLP